MRIAIISDIHANLEALKKALEIISQENIEKIFCLGDTIGYGANPNECLQLVRETTPHVLLGNHDEAAIDSSVMEDFNPYARASAEWTSIQITDEHRNYLRQLPYTTQLDNILFVHSSPYQPNEWRYIMTPADAQDNFSYFETSVCFIGHSHVPCIFSEDIWAKEVVKGKKSLVNVGSIGQPRDGDPRLSFGIFDTSLWMYRNVRAEYDVMKASEKIRKAGLPKPLADRILIGR